MTVLVTGGAGYIGAHLVWELLDRGEQPVVLDNLSTGHQSLVPGKVELVVGDVADTDLVRSVIERHNIESIVHLAGSTVVTDSIADPLRYYDNNTEKTRRLIETAVRTGIRHFVFSSTAAVYGSASGDLPVTEQAVPDPVSPYGASKLMSERMLRDSALAHGLRYAVLRYFNVAGADPNGRCGPTASSATHLIKVAAQTLLGGRGPLQIFGSDYPTPDGTCIRDYIHVSDLAVVHKLALDRLRSGGDSIVLNCGYGRGYSVLDVVSAFRRVAGEDMAVETRPRRPGDVAAIVADPSLIRAELGWRPRHDDLDRIVTDALAWEHRTIGRWPLRASAG